jgi:PAS domain S-box-containing protein
VILAAGLAVAGLGGLTLVGWILGIPVLTRIGSGTIPMASSTALLLVVHGLALCLRAYPAPGSRRLRALWILGGLSVAAALVLLVTSLLGIQSSVEHLGLRISGHLGGAPLGHISPATAACLLLAGLATLLAPNPGDARSRGAIVAFGASAVLLGTSGVFLLAYLYGRPLLYGSGFIPPALNTSLALATLGVGWTWSIALANPLAGEGLLRTRTSIGLLLVFILLASGLVATGHYLFHGMARQHRAEVERQLAIVAEMKVQEITQWRQERLGDGRAFLGNEAFAALVRRVLDTPGDSTGRALLTSWLHRVRLAYRYERVLLIDARGALVTQEPAGPEPVASHLGADVQASLRSGQVSLLDLHRDAPGGPIYLSVLVPIPAGRIGDGAVVVLVLRVDPTVHLYPMLQRWPTPSRTAETLLVRRDGDQVLFLNELRFRRGTALSLRVPLTDRRLPAARAALGFEGILEGVDYRGTHVLAAVRRVPGSSWSLVARIDTAEAMAPLTAQLWLMVLLVAALVCGTGTAVGLIWRRQRVRLDHERREAAAALRASEARYRDLVVGLEDVVFSLDAEGRFRYLSPAVRRAYGYAPEELVGRSFRELVHPDDLAGLTESFGRTLAGASEAYEFRVLDREGRVRHLRSTSRLRLEEDQSVSLYGVLIDLTELHEAWAAQRRSAERWQSTFDAISDLVCVISNDRRFVEINQAGCRALGLPRDQIVGRHCYELVHGASAPIVACPCHLPTTGPSPAQSRLEEAGKVYDLVAWPILDAEGRMSGFVHIVKDITAEVAAGAEKARLEEQLRLGQRLEAVGRLAGGVAHDFNNLLSVISGNAGFALEALAPTAPVRADVLEIQDAATRAAALTRQLLAFSRRQILQPRVISLNQTVSDLEKLLRRLLGEDIQIGVHLAEDLGSVQADPGQLEQVLVNLAVNARDAMPRGGRLLIETANVELDEHYADQHVTTQPGRFVQLSVSDTGTGMPPEVLEHVFEPFFTTKEQGKGTGLGLATVYGIVKQSGGNIWVYSEPGQGTTFKIYLPRVEAPAAVDAARPAAGVATGSETVLLVEDEEGVRRIAARILRSAGYQVLSAASGPEALAIVETHAGALDLLLTDVVMPRMSGRELADRLVALRPGLRVLFASGYTDEAIVHHGVLDPGTHFIGKPFSAAELTRKVREVLDAGPAPARPIA